MAGPSGPGFIRAFAFLACRLLPKVSSEGTPCPDCGGRPWSGRCGVSATPEAAISNPLPPVGSTGRLSLLRGRPRPARHHVPPSERSRGVQVEFRVPPTIADQHPQQRHTRIMNDLAQLDDLAKGCLDRIHAVPSSRVSLTPRTRLARNRAIVAQCQPGSQFPGAGFPITVPATSRAERKRLCLQPSGVRRRVHPEDTAPPTTPHGPHHDRKWHCR